MKYAIFSVLLLFMFGVVSSVNAQFADLTQAEVEVDFVPENPGPNQTVYVSVVSYITDINSSIITWRVNGKIEKSGRGEKTFNFKTGNIGSLSTLSVSIITAEGESIEKIFPIKPAGVDLTWESDSFVPPFYKGKAMFSYQSPITFIAIPHITNGAGVEINAKNLVYKWIKNGSVVETESGYGKNTYSMVGPLIARTLEIRVEVSSPNSPGLAVGMMSIDPINPLILFYKKDPIYGIEFQKALRDTVELNDSKEILVVGAPFFFGETSSSAPELKYKWAINGNPIVGSSSGPTQVFRGKEGVSGVSNISLSVEHSNKILEIANGNFNLKFESLVEEARGI